MSTQVRKAGTSDLGLYCWTSQSKRSAMNRRVSSGLRRVVAVWRTIRNRDTSLFGLDGGAGGITAAVNFFSSFLQTSGFDVLGEVGNLSEICPGQVRFVSSREFDRLHDSERAYRSARGC